MDKYINLNEQDRFIKTSTLRDAYLHYEDSSNVNAKPYITFDNGLELGIVSGQNLDVVKAVSSILTNSLEDGKDTNGGYLPPKVVERVQYEIMSPYGISSLWGTTGHRFVLSRESNLGMREIVASILIARRKSTIFFFTGRYNNLLNYTMKNEVDLDQPFESDPNQKWFDQFAFPDIEKFKPTNYHQIANFVVEKQLRRQGLARFLIENIVKYYSRNYILLNNSKVEHSQYLLCGDGFWQIGDPPWFIKMKALGFYLRAGAESFFIEQPWSKLPPIYLNDKQVSNTEYNKSFGLPELYDNFIPYPSEHHLMERVPKVIELSQNHNAKLQYFQAMYNFI